MKLPTKKLILTPELYCMLSEICIYFFLKPFYWLFVFLILWHVFLHPQLIVLWLLWSFVKQFLQMIHNCDQFFYPGGTPQISNTTSVMMLNETCFFMGMLHIYTYEQYVHIYKFLNSFI